MRTLHWLRVGLVAALGLGSAFALSAAPQAELLPGWDRHNPGDTRVIDHGPWQTVLDRYLRLEADGRATFAYAQVTPEDRRLLQDYLRSLQSLPIRSYNRAEQRAYWINLYNARTVELILEHPQVKSILDIRFGLTDFGPWDRKMLRVEGTDLSLNDVEHRILRPVWPDPRIHYAVNCASYGCPNLDARVYTPATLEAQLEAAARAHLAHPRGLRFEGDTLVLSSIFDWYKVDFGGTDAGLLDHVRRYAPPAAAARLRNWRGPIRYEYDWALNAAP